MRFIPMKTLHPLFWRGFSSLGILLTALLTPGPTASSAVDETINKGVWKLLYNATDAQVNSPAWLSSDSDGDGLTNQAELDAGTNPFNPTATHRVTSLTATATNVSIAFPTLPKKLYFVE